MERWNNINKLMSLKVNASEGGREEARQKEIISELVKQSLLNQQWVEEQERE